MVRLLCRLRDKRRIQDLEMSSRNDGLGEMKVGGMG